MKTVLKFPGSSIIWHGSEALPAEIPTTAKPNHHLSPSFPRNPLSPPSDPVQRRLQSPSAKSNFLAVLTCLLVIAQGFALFASAGNKNQIVDATHTLIVDREWKLSDEYPKEYGAIPASQYVEDKSGKTHPMQFSQDQQSVTLFLPLEKSAVKGTKKQVAVSGELASSKNGVRTYVFAANAGGRLIVKPHGKGLEAEYTQYGSAVWLVSSVRGRLDRRIKPQQ